MPTPKFPGKAIKLGGVEYVVPAIALGKLKQLQPRLAEIRMNADGSLAPNSVDAVVDLALAAFNRNYPDMTKSELEELLDLGNVGEVLKVVYGQSGLEPVEKPELEGKASL